MTTHHPKELGELIARVKQAQQRFASFSQEQVDRIFRSAALAAADAHIPLARMAVQETGMGILEDKVIKNHFASEYIYNKYKDEKTCGILSEDDNFGTLTIARQCRHSVRHCAHHQSDIDRHLQGLDCTEDP